MSIEIKVPVLPESIADALVSTWYKKPGEAVKRDEHLVDIETDKVVLEVVAPADGSLEAILKPTGSTVHAQEVIAMFKEGASESASKAPASGSGSAPKPEAPSVSGPKVPPAATPSARQLMNEKNIDQKQVAPGENGRIKKEDVLKSVAETKKQQKAVAFEAPKTSAMPAPTTKTTESGKRQNRHAPMIRHHQHIA